MFRTILWYTKFFVTMILGTPKLIKANKILKEKGQKEFDNYVYNITSKWTLQRIKDSGANIKIYGEENIPNDKNVLFISNHQSNFDIAIFIALIKKNVGFVAKVEMEKAPILSQWMKNIHCIFMDRNDIKKAAKTIIEGINLLKNGYSLVIFPEGTRSRCNKMGKFKAGSFKLATKSKTTIIPVTIDGSYKLMEGNNNIIKPDNVNIYIHKPIDVTKLSKEEINTLPKTVYDIIEKPIKIE